ncbi:transmembrane 220 family protein [Leadbetterella sp. DM7]|uniref:transmembrane 220 family protein n=1 Tax=Leadbetterella sp. DM7 TaxID=3235085 RepID=UPI00349EB9BD
MKYLLYSLIVIYVLSAAVQYNDPDPLVWMLVYLIPAALCYYRSQGRGDRVLYLSIGLVYLAWAVNQFPPQWEGLMFENLRMKTVNVELGRESLGLGMCALGMWLCAWRSV